MEQVPRYTDSLTMTEYRIACCDELDLEAIVWEYDHPSDSLERAFQEADRAALREIDKLKLADIYETEREKLAALLDPPAPAFDRLAKRIAQGELEPLRNFLDGFRSPDPEQRARFERLYDEYDLGTKTPRDFWVLLQCLEQAQQNKKKGRPRAVPPWRNVVEHLDAMRKSVAAGASVPMAAEVAAINEGRVNKESRAHYFERLYRQRMALRN